MKKNSITILVTRLAKDHSLVWLQYFTPLPLTAPLSLYLMILIGIFKLVICMETETKIQIAMFVNQVFS